MQTIISGIHISGAIFHSHVGVLSIFAWLCTLYVCTANPASGNEDNRNLAWERIKGFVRVWNHTNQGICVALPESAEQGLRFSVTPADLSFTLNKTDNATSKRYLPRVWVNNYDNTTIKWTKIPMIPNMRETWLPLPNTSETDLMNHTCTATIPAFNITINKDIQAGPLISSGNQTHIRGNNAFSSVNLSRPCEYYPWDPTFDPLAKPDYYEADYTLNITVKWCVRLPNTRAVGPFDSKNLMWFWSRTVNTAIPLQPGRSRTWEHSPLFNCTRVITCEDGPGDPLETWFLYGIRTLIRDMCTCWGYPSMGWRNNDTRCNTTQAGTSLQRICGIPNTHYPVEALRIDSQPPVHFMDYNDRYSCKNSIYPPPFGLAWVCSDGKFYSYLTLGYHAGLQCGVGIPSLCPSHIFNITNLSHRRGRRDVSIPQDKRYH
ncbi:uncharacterized protein LOC116960489 [Tyto alba]|uniref:uncharacterized protein LOC116960489 n=1 Tax=Tyto alba TaxID=56313 RepID=UPI001C683635|nr:uncharacterized protein LOC116960489 [Tyto alba]